MKFLIRFIKENHRAIVQYIVFLVILVVVLQINYDTLFSAYTRITANISVALIRICHNFVFFNPVTGFVQYNNLQIPLHTNFALRYYLYALFIIFLFPANTAHILRLLVFSVTYLFLLNLLKCVVEILSIHTDPTIFNDIIIAFRPVLLVILLHFQIRSSVFAKSTQYWEQKISKQIEIPFYLFLCLFFLMIPMGRIFELIPLDFMIHTILQLAAYITGMFGYPSYVQNQLLILSPNWVLLGKQCLGIGIDIMFVFLVFSIRSKPVNKIIYSLVGLLIMLVMNAVRISFILIHLHKNGKYVLGIEVHDLSNYFFYFIVFILILAYIFWLKDINISNVTKSNVASSSTYTPDSPH